jgi:hypothetical protein
LINKGSKTSKDLEPQKPPKLGSEQGERQRRGASKRLT